MIKSSLNWLKLLNMQKLYLFLL